MLSKYDSGGRIYWCDAQTHKIESSDLLGGDRRELIVSVDGHYWGIVADETYIYFTEWTKT